MRSVLATDYRGNKCDPSVEVFSGTALSHRLLGERIQNEKNGTDKEGTNKAVLLSRKGVTMKIINLTTHEVTISNGLASITFPPSGDVARVDSRAERTTIPYHVAEGITLGIPVIYSQDPKVNGLPPIQAGIFYIVSNYVAQTLRRADLLAPNTDNSAERDEKGQVISVKMFQQYLEEGEGVSCKL